MFEKLAIIMRSGILNYKISVMHKAARNTNPCPT